MVCWLTGYTPEQLESFRSTDLCYGDFFHSAPQPNPNRGLIKGVVCGVRVEEVVASGMLALMAALICRR